MILFFFEHDFLKDQQIIKAIGKTESKDGFEILVIGEDFVFSSRSTKSYIETYHYERTDRMAEKFKSMHEKKNGPFWLKS